ncbi:putative ribonuclease H-like domain-containing protein, partial [Tanacetum coccineum]
DGLRLQPIVSSLRLCLTVDLLSDFDFDYLSLALLWLGLLQLFHSCLHIPDSEEDSEMKPTEWYKVELQIKDGVRSSHKNAAGPSFTNDDPSSPVNAAKASNAFEEHLFERFSAFKNAFTLPYVSNVTPMDDTGFFDSVMSDSEGSAVTYTSVYTDSEPERVFWGTDEEVSEGGVPRVIILRARFGHFRVRFGLRPKHESRSEGRFTSPREADLNNLETTMNVSPIPKTRIDKDHPKDQIIGDLNSAIQTRRMIKISNEHVMVCYINQQRRTNHKDYQNCLFTCFLSKKEPKKVFQALEYLSWIEGMQEELLQFKLQKVWTLVDLPNGERAIRTKWVFINRKDERGIVVKNKARLRPNRHWVKDEEVEAVDVHLYRSMIGSLMYLTAFGLDIMLCCACARVLHLTWGFSDSDYARASLDRKSTTGGCQFLGKRLISWQCKKQTIVANSTTEAEYVAAANCYGQVLWIQNQMLDYGYNLMNTNIYIDNESTICIVKNPVSHSKTKHIEIRHHFIRDSYEKKLIQVIKIHTDQNVADLLTKAFDVSSPHLRRTLEEDDEEVTLRRIQRLAWLDRGDDDADLYGFADTLEAAPGRRMSRELGYGIRDTWDDLVGAIQEIAPTTLEGVNQRVIGVCSATFDEEDEIIIILKRKSMPRRTAVLMEEEARLSRAAWAQSMDACDQTHSEGILLRTTVMTQQSEKRLSYGQQTERTDSDFRAAGKQISEERQEDYHFGGITRGMLEDTPRNNQILPAEHKGRIQAVAYAAGEWKLGHLAKDCRSRPTTANNNNRNNNNNNNRNNNNPRAQGANTNAIVCFECGTPGHFRSNCPQWKTKNQGNGSGVARAYASWIAGQNPGQNKVVFFFRPNAVEMGYLDVIIGMDWMTRKYQAIIDCAKKIVRIPFGSEILIFHGDGSRNKRGTRLNIISCTKAQKYVLQGCHVFLAHIYLSRETGDTTKQDSNWKEYMVPAPVARRPYRFAPSEMTGMVGSIQELSDKGFIRTLFITMGSSSSISSRRKMGSFGCALVYRDTKQTNGEVPFIPSYENCSKERHLVGLPSELVMDIRIPRHAVWFLTTRTSAVARTSRSAYEDILELLMKEELYAKFPSVNFGGLPNSTVPRSLMKVVYVPPILALLRRRSEDFIVFCDALRRRVWALVIDAKKKEKANLNAQTEAGNQKISRVEDVGGMLMKMLNIQSNEEQESWNLVRMEPMHSMAGVGFLVMAICGRKKMSSLFVGLKLGEVHTHGPEIVQETTERIIQVKQRMQAARDRQKSYADLKRKPMEFEVGDKVMLKVSPWKGVVRFGKRGKLNPRSQIVKLIKRLKAKRYPISQDSNGTPEERPEFTWEREDQFKKKYPHLFTKTAPSSSAVRYSYCKELLLNRLYLRIAVIMEYLVNISKKRKFWSLNEDILKIYYSDYQNAISIKEDAAYSCLHSIKTTKERRPIRRIQKKSICCIEDIVCEYSGRYQTWSLLQETPIHRIKSLGYAIMPPTMTTRSAGRPVAASRGGGTGERASRDGGRTRGRSGDQGDGRNDGSSGQVRGQGSKVNGGVNGVPDFSTIIAQQL